MKNQYISHFSKKREKLFKLSALSIRNFSANMLNNLGTGALGGKLIATKKRRTFDIEMVKTLTFIQFELHEEEKAKYKLVNSMRTK